MDFSAHNPNTSNELNFAARHNLHKLVRRLLKKKNPNTVDNRGWTSLHEAAHKDSYESLKLILKHKRCRPMCETHEGHTALYLACRNKASLKTIELLLHKVHDIANFGSTEGVTPLHIVSSQGRVELIQLLLDYGALINVQDFDGDTPLHDAILSVQYEAVMMLLHAGADASITNSGGYTPFHLAASKGSLPIVEAVFPFVTNIDQSTIAKHTAFMLSVVGGNIEVIDFLLKYGANPYLKDAKGNMALDIALTHGCELIFSKMFSITHLSEINKKIIFNACKPHYFKMKILQLLLNSDLGPEYFYYSDECNIVRESFTRYMLPPYIKNAPLNIFLNICEYIYRSTPDLFLEFFLLFLIRGVDVNAVADEECPPLVYIQFCSHQHCFKSVFEILVAYGCNVDYCSFLEPNKKTVPIDNRIPDAFRVALNLDPSLLLIMLPFTLYCDPGILLLYACMKLIINSLPTKVYIYLLASTDNTQFLVGEPARHISFSMRSLKQLCRYKIRQTIIKARTHRVKRTTEFINIINSLPIPPSMCNYLRFM